MARFLRWSSPLLLTAALVVLAVPAAAQAKDCGSISSRKFHDGRGSVFTYKYAKCRTARRVLKAYVRRLGRVSSCEPYGCEKRVRGWKCHTPLVHGTLLGCVPVGAPWEGTGRPFIGVSGIP